MLRLGWLLPQLVVGFLAERAERRMPFYVFGAYGRAVMTGLIAVVHWVGSDWSPMTLATVFLILWTLYALISGVVAVPYHAIVGRSIRSEARSRMLALRFFGGGIFALGVAAFVRMTLDVLPALQTYALIFELAALLLIGSSTLFLSAGEPSIPTGRNGRKSSQSAVRFLKGVGHVLAEDGKVRLFLYSQRLGGSTLMALPFYVVAAASQNGIRAADVGVLLGARTTGALASNPVWGKLGDSGGRLRMLQIVAIMRMLPPLAVLALLGMNTGLIGFAALFLAIGAMMNGVTFGHLGYLMEISANDRRPAYSAYFNALASPAALLPLVGAGLVSLIAIEAVFVAAILAAICKIVLLARMLGWRLSGPNDYDSTRPEAPLDAAHSEALTSRSTLVPILGSKKAARRTHAAMRSP